MNSIQKISSVGLLFSSDELPDTKEKISELLNVSNEKIKWINYVSAPKKSEEQKNFFSEKNFGFKAKINSKELQDFVNTEFDLLINYTTNPNIYNNVTALLSKAKFKAGFANIDDKLFDLVIVDPTFNTEIFHQELIKYLTILNKL